MSGRSLPWPEPGSNPPKAQLTAGVNRQLLWLAGVLIAMLISLTALSATIGMAGAVIAQGQVRMQSDVMKIQHPTGGVVSEILVKDGSHVRAGDVLVALDPTAPGANVSIVDEAVSELSAKQSRLEAERDGRAAPKFDRAALEGSVGRRAELDEGRLFKLHLATRAGEKAELRQRIAQLNAQIRSYEEGAQAKKRQTELISQELVGLRELFQQNLVPLARLNALERDAAQLNGDVAQLSAAGAETRGKINETELQVIQIDQAAQAEAGNQLGDVQSRLAELRQRKVTVQQDFRRVQVRSPQDGIVDHLAIHTVGGVIAPGEAIMQIVPDKDRFHVEARIRTGDVDQVHVGQAATLRFTTFDQGTTPAVNGQVTHVSAQAETEEKTDAAYFVVDIDVPPTALTKTGLNLVPGMPVETFIQTRRRTLLSFLVKPLTDQIKLAFREG